MSAFNPLQIAGPITKSDTDRHLGYVTSAVLLDAVGALKVTDHAGNDVTFASGDLAANVWHPMNVRRIWSTGSGSQDVFVQYDAPSTSST